MPLVYEPSPTNVTAHYANGVKLVLDFIKTPFGDRGPNWITRLGTCPVRFVGDEGWVETGDSGEIVVEPASLQGEIKTESKPYGLDVTTHARNFFDCIKSPADGGQPAGDAALAPGLPRGRTGLDAEPQADLEPDYRVVRGGRRGERTAVAAGPQLGRRLMPADSFGLFFSTPGVCEPAARPCRGPATPVRREFLSQAAKKPQELPCRTQAWVSLPRSRNDALFR